MTTLGYLAAIEAICERDDGLLDARKLVHEARAGLTEPGRALHGAFEWDDRVAGDKYRLGQAKALIRRFKAYVVLEHELPAPVRRFLNVEPHVYGSVEAVMADPQTADAVIALYRTQVQGLLRHLRGLTDLRAFLLSCLPGDAA